MQSAEEFAWTLYAEEMDFHDHCWHDKDATVRLIAARDEAIRADERGRCSVVHATLTDEALVAELVRRGVLTEDDGGTCDTDTRTHAVNCSCFGGSDRQRRYVTAWEPIEGDA